VGLRARGIEFNGRRLGAGDWCRCGRCLGRFDKVVGGNEPVNFRTPRTAGRTGKNVGVDGKRKIRRGACCTRSMEQGVGAGEDGSRERV